MHTPCIAAGGNLLLAVGPRADGSITAEQASRLTALGRWIARDEPAVFGTTRGIPAGRIYAPTTVAADRRTLYAPAVWGLRPGAGCAGGRCAEVADPVVTVLAIELEGEIEVYRGEGRG